VHDEQANKTLCHGARAEDLRVVESDTARGAELPRQAACDRGEGALWDGVGLTDSTALFSILPLYPRTSLRLHRLIRLGRLGALMRS
jgi:hypothetical protein